MKPGQSVVQRYAGRDVQNGHRVRYDPEWSRSRPFHTYRHGTAGASFKKLEHAKHHLAPPDSEWSEWR